MIQMYVLYGLNISMIAVVLYHVKTTVILESLSNNVDSHYIYINMHIFIYVNYNNNNYHKKLFMHNKLFYYLISFIIDAKEVSSIISICLIALAIICGIKSLF